MLPDDAYLTPEEKILVVKLRSEMFNAMTLEHMKFYKAEMEKIYEQAERREAFKEKMKKMEEEIRSHV
ncbi:hypothetical protein [Bacillus sp. SJS]|uniref:hypothetical protein n=1 Tax=Bacillus sp. SJS TaxID=1423321 RepID=UPI0004DD775A|nr:hypothetical protein [Bacillus sp. SJS]KZZ85246.1 hypothetical protein AS29_006595 [Bacillus sp. SJS]